MTTDPDFLARLVGKGDPAPPTVPSHTTSTADNLVALTADYLTTSQLARLLGVRRADLRAAAARLGLCPGVAVVTDWRGPRVTRVWAPEWAEELRAEIERQERWDWTVLV